MGWLYLSSSQFHVVVGVYVYVPAFYESPANSARLTGRSPLTSKPVRPHELCILPFQGPESTPEAFFHCPFHLAVGGFFGDLPPLVVLLLAAGDGELQFYEAILAVKL